MLNVEQFVYTTASIGNKKGYQIVAQSKGITSEIIGQLENYFYPVGMDPSEFRESRSLLLLKDDFIAYSRIKNIGKGYDGRDNTLYNHTFVFRKDEFMKYYCDSRIFDKFYLEDKSIQGDLPTLSIDPPIPDLPIKIEHEEFFLKELLFSLFSNYKIALIFNNIDLPQKILTFLPRTMRLIPFSTLVIDPQKQTKYRFIMIPKATKSKLKGDFKLISPDNPPSITTSKDFGKIISYYASLILTHRYDDIKDIQNSFEKISDATSKDKLTLLCEFKQFESSLDKEQKSIHAENMIKILKKLDSETTAFYFDKIKGYLKQYTALEEKLKPTINPSTSLLDAFFLLPSQIMFNLYKSFLNSQSNEENEDETSNN